jgi:exoribonuclease R
MMDLLAYNVGDGYCHAWYARRFLSPVKVVEDPKPHAGLGLDRYVQWSSPIRRFQDLQVHCSVKRSLRRQRVNELIESGATIPEGLTTNDLGCEPPVLDSEGKYVCENAPDIIDPDINYSDRAGLLGAARTLQRASQRYWLFEYIQRLSHSGKKFDVLVLGCVDPGRRQYAIYIYELGFEYKYISPVGNLKAGTRLQLKVASVFPRSGQLSLTPADGLQ